MNKKKIDFCIKVLFSIIGIFLISYFMLHVLKVTHLTLIYVLFWIGVAIFSYYFIGYRKSRKILQKDTIQIVIISVLLYLLLTYLFGLFVGFSKTPVSLKPLSILLNILPVIIIIVTQEFIRYVVVCKIKEHKLWLAFMTLLFVLSEIIGYVFLYNFKNYSEIFEFLGLAVIGTIFNNMLYTYIAYHVGWKPNLFYRIITECYIYFVPFVPNPGTYINTIFHILLPVILMIVLSRLYEKEEKVVMKRPRYHWIYFIIITVFIGLQMCLVSGLFRYQILAVASNSMNPVFYRGDAVIVEKRIPDELETNQVIAFKKDGNIFVHRIVKVRKENNVYYYTTKGDNNNVEDEGELIISDVVGIVEYVVPVIGYPTVWLNELLN